MKKYMAVARITMINILRFRWEIIIGQARTVLLLVTLFFLWNKVYGSRETLFSFTRGEILTYIIAAAVAKQITIVSATDQIAGELQSWGKFFSYLLKPIGYFRYWLAVDVVYKLINVSLMLLVVLLFLKIFELKVIFPKDPVLILLFLTSITVASMIYFYIGIITATTGFWTSHVWGLQFLVVLTLEFSAGAYFPIDVLPSGLQQAITFTPFPYLLYFPIKIFLGKMTTGQSLEIIAVSLIWLSLSFLLAKLIWNKGLKTYEAWGG